MIKKNYLWQVHVLRRKDETHRATFFRHDKWSRTYTPTRSSLKRLKRAICGRFGYYDLMQESVRVFPAR